MLYRTLTLVRLGGFGKKANSYGRELIGNLKAGPETPGDWEPVVFQST